MSQRMPSSRLIATAFGSVSVADSRAYEQLSSSSRWVHATREPARTRSAMRGADEHGAGGRPNRRIDPSDGVQTATWSQSVAVGSVTKATREPSAESIETGAAVATTAAARTRSFGGTGRATGGTGASRGQ